MKSVTKFIEKKLGLIVNATKSQIGRPQQIKFLGFGYFIGKDGKYQAKPCKLSIDKLKIKLKKLTSRKWSISLDLRLRKLGQQIIGWVNNFRTLDRNGTNVFQLPANPNAKNNARVHFTPIYYPNGNYQCQGFLTDLWTPAGMLSGYYNSNIINISGTSYDDWHVAGR